MVDDQIQVGRLPYSSTRHWLRPQPFSGRTSDGVVVGLSFTLGTAVVHELGHAVKGVQLGGIYGANAHAAAVHYENQHRLMLSKHPSGPEDSTLTRRAPFDPLWRPLVNAVRRNPAWSMMGLAVGALPAFGFLAYYLNQDRGLGDPVFDQIHWLFWAGLPAEILLNWTDFYMVSIWEAHQSLEETAKRWVVYVVVNMLLCMLLAVGLAEAVRAGSRYLRSKWS